MTPPPTCIRLNRQHNRVRFADASADSDPNKAFINSAFFRPISDGLPAAIYFYPAITPHVVTLLDNSGPANILRFVVTIIVDALKAVLATGTKTYIRYKVFECHPALTDSNSASTVMFKVVAILVRTALTHINPNLVLGRI